METVVDDDVLSELRTTNRILLLAHGEAIERRVKAFLDHAPTKSVLTILVDSETTADVLQAKAQAAGVPRSSLYRILADLERAGLVDRPRRGTVGLSTFAAPFIPVTRSSKTGAKERSDEGPASEEAIES